MPPLFLSALAFGVMLLLWLAWWLRVRSRRLPLASIREDRMAWRMLIATGVVGVAWASINLAYAIIAQIGRLHS